MMKSNYWSWQQKDWPNFTYKTNEINALEQKFLEQMNFSYGVFKHLTKDQKTILKIDLLCDEAYKTSEIEGELLNRDSLQSSIKREFGLKANKINQYPAEHGIAEMMYHLYSHFEQDLTHQILFDWHQMLMNGRRDILLGAYRIHKEPMQIISGYIGREKIHFEAPTSDQIHFEMSRFIEWFNRTSPKEKTSLPPLTRAAITHLYFETIHPFEDGNGRIGRALVEKALAQYMKCPTLIALSHIIQDHKKPYYKALEAQNTHNEITEWILYFANTLLLAQSYTISKMEFLIKKTHFFDQYKDLLNPRQTKAILKIFDQGIEGFKGGLSAKNYMTITKTSASTATRDLADLVEKKIFTQTGERKTTRYWPNLNE